MFDFLKIQYKLGKVTPEQLQTLVGKTTGITAEEYAAIIGQSNNAHEIA